MGQTLSKHVKPDYPEKWMGHSLNDKMPGADRTSMILTSKLDMHQVHVECAIRTGAIPTNPEDPCMEYLPTLTPKVIQNNPNVGKYFIHGSLGKLLPESHHSGGK